MKILLLGLVFGSFIARADVATVMPKGKISDIPSGVKTCFLAIDGEISAMVTCDDKIRIEVLGDVDTQSRGSAISSYTYLLSQKGFSLKNCFANANVSGSNGGSGTSIINYCIFEH